MPKLVVLKGLPCSGKTTLARQLVKENPKKWIRINNDDIRRMLWGLPFDSEDEGLVMEIRQQLVNFAMSKGLSVVVDNVNLNPKLLQYYEDVVKSFNSKNKIQYDFEVIFVDTPVQECIARDALRVEPVGAKVITRFYEKFLKPEFKAIKQNDQLTHVWIVDIDGTVALFPGRNPYDRDFGADIPNEPVVKLVMQRLNRGEMVIFVSGRDSQYRQVSETWLNENVIPSGSNYLLFMREHNDKRDDRIVKREIFDREIRDQYYVELVLDDRQRVVDMWRNDLGLTVLQVADGNF